jgi:hypothetical protein
MTTNATNTTTTIEPLFPIQPFFGFGLTVVSLETGLSILLQQDQEFRQQWSNVLNVSRQLECHGIVHISVFVVVIVVIVVGIHIGTSTSIRLLVHFGRHFGLHQDGESYIETQEELASVHVGQTNTIVFLILLLFAILLLLLLLQEERFVLGSFLRVKQANGQGVLKQLNHALTKVSNLCWRSRCRSC